MRLLIPLFSPATGTWGGLTRGLAVAEAAQSAGHTVAFCAAGELGQVVRARGYPVYEMPVASFLGLPRLLARPLVARSQHINIPVPAGRAIGNIWLVLLFSGMARTRYLKRLVAAQLAATEDFRPDVLFTDLDPGAFLLAQITNLPIAATYASVMEQGRGSFPWRLLWRASAGVLEAYDRRSPAPELLAAGPHVLKIIPSIPLLDDADPERPDVRYVGHLLSPIQDPAADSFAPLPGQDYVFVYVGTGSLSLDTLRDVLPQVFPAGSHTRCLVGSQSVKEVQRIGGVEFRPYVPAEAVLPYCRWTLCHGGQNTITHSLLHDVPLLLFPGPIFERRYNAEKVVKASAGLMGEIGDFTPAWLRQALTQEGRRRTAAERLGTRIESLGGAPAAVAAIEQWVSEGGPPLA